MPTYETAQRFTELGGWQLGSPELVTLDAENVLTPYGSPVLLDGVLDRIAELQRGERGAHVAVATNNKNQAFVDALAGQLTGLEEEVPVFSGIDLPNKKTSPGMFQAAARHFDVNPANAAHVEDQFLSLRGARMAGFGLLVLLKPVGPNAHKGVRFGRPLDAAARLVIGVRAEYRRIQTEGLDW